MGLRNNLKKVSFILSIATFILALGLRHYFHSGNKTPEDFVKNITQRVEKEVLTLGYEIKPVLDHLSQVESISFAAFPSTSKYPYYVFEDNKLAFWSDYRFVPNAKILKGMETYKFLSVAKGQFLVKRWKVDNQSKSFQVYGLIPLFNNVKIENKYLKPQFNESIFSGGGIELSEAGSKRGGYQLCLESGDCLFSVGFEEGYEERSLVYDIATLFLFSLSILLFLFFITGLVSFLIKKQSLTISFWVLATLLTLLRYGMITLNFPNEVMELELFNPENFASSDLNPSLGDLFLNILCLLSLVVFIFRHYPKMGIFQWLMKLGQTNQAMASVALTVLVFFVPLFQYIVFQTLYHNSQYTLDITDTIKFSLPRVVCYLIITANAIIFFLFSHVIYKVFTKINADNKPRMLALFLAGGFLFSMINIAINQAFLAGLVLGMLYFIVLYLMRFPKHLVRLRYLSLIYIFFGAFISAMLGAYSIYNFEAEREYKNKERYARQFLIDKDIYAEYLLNESIKRIGEDVFIRGNLYSPFGSKEIIKKKIRQFYLGSYFDRYDVKIDLYNAKGQPYRGDGNNLDALKVNLNKYEQSYPGLYFSNKVDNEFSQNYISLIKVERNEVTMGFIIIDLKLKKVIPNSVYPELLADSRFLSPFENKDYAYAIYDNGNMIYNADGFNYTQDFDIASLEDPRLYKKGVVSNGYIHHGIGGQDEKVAVVTSNIYPYVNLISNFSFLLLVSVLAVLLLIGFYVFYFSLFKERLNYSAKIQLYLNLAFFMPLIIVSITTISLINSSFKEDVNNEYFKKTESIAANIVEKLDDYLKNPSGEGLKSHFAEVTKYADVDANLFNINGKLLATSQRLIYDNNLLSEHINPTAIANIKEDGRGEFIARESVGGLFYNSTYTAIKSYDTGKLIGILSIPFFQSENQIEKEQIEVFTNIMNIFTIIFIIFLVISYFASKWLTFPLTFITQKLRKTTLSDFNEPLNWDSHDEIGLMVKEYNRMVLNLEESKRALAKNEKESAWREMAQQVAHEIKNPLTPMKLTLQHLSRTLRHGDGLNVKEVDRPINTLLHQVDTLSDIATSFSTFAKMPMPENERYELTSVIRKVVGLHNSLENGSLSSNLEADKMYVNGDEQLTGRIVSNLIINAAQSAESGRELLIEVLLKNINGKKALIEVKDNGKGIPEMIQDKVFMPNFTTKQTGSGIGLAIAKHGIEHSGGKIWFETEPGLGTTFYIEFPLVD